MEQDMLSFEVVVVGGGAAGLSGALALARARRSVLVVDAGQPRNAPAGHVHNYLTRDGTAPAELLAAGRDEVRRYGGSVITGTVEAAERADDGFVLTLDDGRRGDATLHRPRRAAGVARTGPGRRHHGWALPGRPGARRHGG
jgi:thioredoxin reductase